MGPNARRAVLGKAAGALEARKDEFVKAMMGEIGATAGWAMFNLMLAAGMMREAAALTTQIGGEVIPSDKPGCLAMSLREPVGRGARHRSLERADHSGCSSDRDAPGMRQLGHPQGLGDLPAHPRAHHRGLSRGRLSSRASSTWSPTRRRMRARSSAP